MKTKLTLLAGAVAALMISAPAFGQLGGKVGVGAGANAGANTGGANVGIGAKVGVDANAEAERRSGGSRFSGSGDANANSNAGGELRGLNRAETRMSEEGREHEQATTSHAKRKAPRANTQWNTHSDTEGSATTR